MRPSSSRTLIAKSLVGDDRLRSTSRLSFSAGEVSLAIASRTVQLMPRQACSKTAWSRPSLLPKCLISCDLLVPASRAMVAVGAGLLGGTFDLTRPDGSATTSLHRNHLGTASRAKHTLLPLQTGAEAVPTRPGGPLPVLRVSPATGCRRLAMSSAPLPAACNP